MTAKSVLLRERTGFRTERFGIVMAVTPDPTRRSVRFERVNNPRIMMAISPDDFLVHTTVRIECSKPDGGCSGTGFFYTFFYEERTQVPVIITNLHVVEGATQIALVLTEEVTAGDTSRLQVSPYLMDCTNDFFIRHPNPQVDLAIIPFKPFIQRSQQDGHRLKNSTLIKDNVITEEYLNRYLSKIENVLVAGYPDGIWDRVNNLPILRKGLTATPLQFDFLGKKEFLIDSAIYGGSSGSPVFIYDNGAFLEGDDLKKGSRLFLVGIVSAVFQHSVNGSFEITEAPTKTDGAVSTWIPNNLGIVIKASEIFAFEPILRQRLRDEANPPTVTILQKG